jgi:hypothetical protein
VFTGRFQDFKNLWGVQDRQNNRTLGMLVELPPPQQKNSGSGPELMHEHASIIAGETKKRAKKKTQLETICRIIFIFYAVRCRSDRLVFFDHCLSFGSSPKIVTNARRLLSKRTSVR